MAITMLLFFTATAFTQADQRPEYVTVTTLHWNMDNDDFDMDEWKAVEKEYMDKVTSKNEHIRSNAFYMHYLTADNRELISVTTYNSWEDIDKAGDRSGELEKEAWPDADARKAFLKKQNAYYADFHADEIYATMEGAKFSDQELGEDAILYVRKSQRAFPEDGTFEEFNTLRKKALENVVHKNEYAVEYYPGQHAWGSDRREFIEAFILNSLCDLKKMFDRGAELNKEALTEEEGKALGKYFTGVHGDYLFTPVKF